MKKILSKFDRNEKLDNSHNSSSSKETNSFVGKVFTVGRVTVTVEDVLAEGECMGGGREGVAGLSDVRLCVCVRRELHKLLPPDLKRVASASD